MASREDSTSEGLQYFGVTDSQTVVSDGQLFLFCQGAIAYMNSEHSGSYTIANRKAFADKLVANGANNPLHRLDRADDSSAPELADKAIRYPGSYRQPGGNPENPYPKERGAS